MIIETSTYSIVCDMSNAQNSTIPRNSAKFFHIFHSLIILVRSHTFLQVNHLTPDLILGTRKLSFAKIRHYKHTSFPYSKTRFPAAECK